MVDSVPSIESQPKCLSMKTHGPNTSVVLSVEDPAHSDFLLLRNMLVKTHMQDLKDVTRETHYENYRAQCIQNMTRMVVQERKRRLVLDTHTELPRPIHTKVGLIYNTFGTTVVLQSFYAQK